MVTKMFFKMMIYLTIGVVTVDYLINYPSKPPTQLSELGLQHID
jgi:hypothetical protein